MKYTPNQRLIIYIALLWELENDSSCYCPFMCVILDFGYHINCDFLPELLTQKPKVIKHDEATWGWYRTRSTKPRIAAVNAAVKMLTKKMYNHDKGTGR